MDWALPEIHPFELGTGGWGRGFPLPWALVDPSVNQQNQTLWEFGHDPDSVLRGLLVRNLERRTGGRRAVDRVTYTDTHIYTP